MFMYPIEVTPDGDGFLVTAPDFPEVATDAEAVADAPDRARDAIEEAIASRLVDFDDVPRPNVSDRMCNPIDPYLSLKVALLWRLNEEQETRAGLARRLNWHRNSVDRLFMPRHATKLDQFASAFQALGARMELGVVTA